MVRQVEKVTGRMMRGGGGGNPGETSRYSQSNRRLYSTTTYFWFWYMMFFMKTFIAIQALPCDTRRHHNIFSYAVAPPIRRT